MKTKKVLWAIYIKTETHIINKIQRQATDRSKACAIHKAGKKLITRIYEELLQAS